MKSGLKALRSIFFMTAVCLSFVLSLNVVFADETASENPPTPIDTAPTPSSDTVSASSPEQAPPADTQAAAPEINAPKLSTSEIVPVSEPVAQPSSTPETPPMIPSAENTSPTQTDINPFNSGATNSLTLKLDEDLKNKVFGLLDTQKQADIFNALATGTDNLEITLNINIKTNPSNPKPSASGTKTTQMISSITAPSVLSQPAPAPAPAPAPTPINSVPISSAVTSSNLSTSPSCDAECQKGLLKNDPLTDIVPQQAYTGPTMSACENGCMVWVDNIKSSEPKSDHVDVKPADTLGGMIYNWNIAHLNKGEEVKGPLEQIWYTIPVVPGAHAGSVDIMNNIGEGVTKVTDGISQLVTDNAHSILGEKPFPSVKEIVNNPQGIIDSGIQEAQSDPLAYVLKNGIVKPLYTNYLVGQGVATGAAGTIEDLYTIYADPRSVGEGLLTLGTAVVTDPGKVATVVGDKLGKVADESMSDSEKGFTNVGLGIFEVISMLAPESKVKYVAEVKGLGAISKTDDMLKYSDDVLKVSDEIKDVNKVNKMENVAGSTYDVMPFQAPIPRSGTATIQSLPGEAPIAKIEPAKLKVTQYQEPTIVFNPIPGPKELLTRSKDILDIAKKQNIDLNKTYTNIISDLGKTIDQTVKASVTSGSSSSSKSSSAPKSSSNSSKTSAPKSSSTSTSSSSKTLSSPSSTAPSVVSSSVKAVSSVVSSASSSASSVVKSVSSSASSAVNSAAKATSSAVSSASKAVSSAVSSASTSVSSAAKSVSSSVSSISKAVSTSAASAVSSASKAVSSAAKAISSFIKF